MSRARKTLDEVLSGRSDQTIRFDALCSLLSALGFQERIRGSHHIFTQHWRAGDYQSPASS